jgi:hypothetical protein
MTTPIKPSGHARKRVTKFVHVDAHTTANLSFHDSNFSSHWTTTKSSHGKRSVR